MTFMLGFIGGVILTIYHYEWNKATRDARIINEDRRKQYEFYTKWSKDTAGCPPPPTNILVAR